MLPPEDSPKSPSLYPLSSDVNPGSASPSPPIDDSSGNSNVEKPVQAIIAKANREAEKTLEGITNDLSRLTSEYNKAAVTIMDSIKPAYDAINMFQQNSQLIPKLLAFPVYKPLLNNLAANSNVLIDIVNSTRLTGNLFSQLPTLQTTFDYTSILAGIDKQLIPIRNMVISFAESCSKSLRLIYFDLYKFITDPLLDDIFEAHRGDIEAASRIADRINWSPNLWLERAIRLKARINGKPLKEIYREALTQGVILALRWNEDDELPILIQPESTWVYDNDRSLVTLCPGKLSFNTFWPWVKEEATRAAGLWLIGHPYAAAFVVVEPPIYNCDIQLVKFTSLSPENKWLDAPRGRPLNSGIFKDRDEFLKQVMLAVEHVQSRGNRVTQQRVAEFLSQKELLGDEDPERQLQRWREAFEFQNWQHLLTHIKQLMSP